MRDYFPIARLERDGFEVVVDRTYEDISIRDCFDDSCYDIEDMIRKVDAGDLEWFMLRVRVLLDGHELGSNYLGGCLYDWNKIEDVMTDGTAEDCIYSAMLEAKAEVKRLKEKLNALAVE